MRMADYRRASERYEGLSPGSVYGHVFDAETGEDIPYVFFWDEKKRIIGRYDTEPDNPEMTRTVVTGVGDDGWELRDMVRIWEHRPFRFVPLEESPP